MAEGSSPPRQPWAEGSTPPSAVRNGPVHVFGAAGHAHQYLGPRVGYFSVPPSQVERKLYSRSDDTLRTALSSRLVAAGSSPPPRPCPCGAVRCTKSNRHDLDQPAGSRHVLEGRRPALVLASGRTAPARERAPRHVPFGLRRVTRRQWPAERCDRAAGGEGRRALWARRPPSLTREAARHLAAWRRACGARRPRGPASSFAAAGSWAARHVGV